MRQLSLVVLVILSASLLINCEVKLPQYVGVGYNLFTGNPKTDKIDPGFKSQIFRLTYTNEFKTEDGEFLVPDNMTTSKIQSCSYSSKVSQYTGTKSYQKDLTAFVELGVGVDAGIKSASFSASSEFSSVKTSIKDDESVITESYSACELYSVQIPRFLALELSRDFKQAIQELAADKLDIDTIVDAFGTHFVSKTIFGGRAHIQFKMSREKLQELESMGIDVKTAAKLSYARITGDAKVNWKQDEKKVNIFDKKTEETKHIFVGGKPPKNGDLNEWQQEIRSQIAPIRYEIKSMTELFNQRYFPDISQQKLNELKSKHDEFVKKLAEDFKPLWDNGNDENLPGKPTIKLHKTPLYGYYTSGGHTFEDKPNENIGSSVRRVLLRTGGCIDRIQFLMSDAVNSNYTEARGSFGGREAEWPVPDDEYIRQIELRHNKYVHCITFITNKGNKSPTYGTCKGNYAMINLPGELVGVHGRADIDDWIYQLGFISREVVYDVKNKKTC